jgi:hypothetical protein
MSRGVDDLTAAAAKAASSSAEAYEKFVGRAKAVVETAGAPDRGGGDA